VQIDWWIIVVFLHRNSLTITIVSQKYRDLLQPYSNDRFKKKIKNFLCKWKLENNRSIPSTHAKRQITNLTVKHSFSLYPSLSTYGQNDRQRNEYTCCAWAGGTFFPVVVLCQFLVLAENRFWFYILMYLEYNTVVGLC
jgi:hypothetical protein